MRSFLPPFILCWLLVFSFQSVNAQAPFKNGLAVKFLVVDHLRTLQSDSPKLFNDVTFGGELSYHRWLGNHFNLAIPLRLGQAKLPQNSLLPSPNSDPEFFGSLDLTAQWHPLATKAVSPYLLTGIGGFYTAAEGISAEVPMGLGFNFRMNPNLYLQLQSEYRHDFTAFRSNVMHSFGVLFSLKGKGKKIPEELPAPDRDGDGTPDLDDQCPDTPGPAAFAGCPDSDGDGIADPKDNCPQQAGPIENKGCPLADTDGDGVLDAEDDCPQQAGPVALKGCPDSDGDGLIDPIDSCPNLAGPASNNGCPEIKEEVIETLNYVAQNVQFQTGKATLKEVSFSILDKVVVIMQQYPNYSIAIGGHTDSIGDAATNQLLSERRAKSCYDYLVSRGVSSSRMNYVGYGETRPIGDNRYKEGREKNRRTEFSLYLTKK